MLSLYLCCITNDNVPVLHSKLNQRSKSMHQTKSRVDLHSTENFKVEALQVHEARFKTHTTESIWQCQNKNTICYNQKVTRRRL